jgi:O-antigen/teichoic acid export membrane protein
MSRAHRASIATAFAYLQFGLAILVGVALVPFVLHQVGGRLYGYWLASGEVLAYAAMADLGVMGVVPWLIAEADGRRDRDAIRRLMSTGFCATLVVSATYVAIVFVLWHVAPVVLKLPPDDKAAIGGPLAVLACVTAIVLPFRIANSALMGLQDVKFAGAISTLSWVLDLAITVTLLLEGYGLYALALGAAVPPVVSVAAGCMRLRFLAPDLMSGWPRPSGTELARLFREGFGAWLGQWGWRLSAATDAIVLAWLGHPIWITVLAMSGKLSQTLTQMSWPPGDSALVGLAQLSGENRPQALRSAVAAVLRVYLVLATAGTCIVLAVNGAFVSRWVGADMFGGTVVNAMLAALIITTTVTHGAAAVSSVLGKRTHVGVATVFAGAVQVALALLLARRVGLIGIPLAALSAQLLLLIPSLLTALAHRTALGPAAFLHEVIRPWSLRSVPLILVCALAGPALIGIPLWASIPLGGMLGVTYLWLARQLILDYPPIEAVVRARLSSLRLDGLLPLAADRPAR